MRRIFMFLGVIGAMAVTSGCGLDKIFNQKQVYKFNNKTDAQTVFNQSRVECESGDCPEYIGGLVTYTDLGRSWSVQVCSLTLIAKDTVLTNRHCIPDDLQYRDASCAGRIRIKLNSSGSRASENFECVRVVALSPADTDDSAIYADWAVLRLNGSSRFEPADLSLDGIGDATSLTMWPVYYHLNSGTLIATGKVRRVSCQSEFDGSTMYRYLNRLSAVFKFDSCSRTIIEGNSGSGAFSSSGDLVGVISAITGARGEDLTHGAYQGGGTSLACISAIGGNSSRCSR